MHAKQPYEVNALLITAPLQMRKLRHRFIHLASELVGNRAESKPRLSDSGAHVHNHSSFPITIIVSISPHPSSLHSVLSLPTPGCELREVGTKSFSIH